MSSPSVDCCCSADASQTCSAPTGVFLGGVITEYLSWPWVFYSNIPIAVIALIAAPALMPAGGAGAHGPIDIGGALIVTVGLGAAVYAIVRAPEVGWRSVQTWGLLLAAVVLLGIFLAIQNSRREPLMRLSIFRTPNLGAPTSPSCCSAQPGSRCGSSSGS